VNNYEVLNGLSEGSWFESRRGSTEKGVTGGLQIRWSGLSNAEGLTAQMRARSTEQELA